MNYYERHLGDYARDAGHLSMLEHGAYQLLLDRYYTTEQGIPADQAHRLCRAKTREERDAVDAVLREFFTLTDGVWINGRAEREIEKARARVSAARENGKRGGRPKRTEPEPSGNPVGSHSVSSGVPSEKLTTYQTPVTKEELSEEANASSSSAEPTNAGARPSVPCPYADIVAAYHELLPELPKVRLMDGKTGDARRKAMRSLWGWVLSSRTPDGRKRADTADEALAWVRGYFGHARGNDFLMGRQQRSGEHAGWKADFDFLLTQRGMRHVIERTEAA